MTKNTTRTTHKPIGTMIDDLYRQIDTCPKRLRELSATLAINQLFNLFDRKLQIEILTEALEGMKDEDWQEGRS